MSLYQLDVIHNFIASIGSFPFHCAISYLQKNSSRCSVKQQETHTKFGFAKYVHLILIRATHKGALAILP